MNKKNWIKIKYVGASEFHILLPMSEAGIWYLKNALAAPQD